MMVKWVYLLKLWEISEVIKKVERIYIFIKQLGMRLNLFMDFAQFQNTSTW